ncbi:MAG TPA: gamma-glutamylcyclotransferase [Streptosporangiaceae bacterium]
MPYMFLNGGGMAGGELHHLLRGAPLVDGEARTAPRYRLHSVGDRYPALEPVGDGGAVITGEVYDLPLEVLRDWLLPAEPAELELGVIELADGTPSLGMVLRRPCPPLDELTDISEHGGWRFYRDQQSRNR